MTRKALPTTSPDRSDPPDADWGFDEQQGGMALETKLGLTLTLCLLAAFGFVVYEKFGQITRQSAGESASANAETAPGSEGNGETPPMLDVTPGGRTESSGPTNAPESTPASGEPHWPADTTRTSQESSVPGDTRPQETGDESFDPFGSSDERPSANVSELQPPDSPKPFAELSGAGEGESQDQGPPAFFPLEEPSAAQGSEAAPVEGSSLAQSPADARWPDANPQPFSERPTSSSSETQPEAAPVMDRPLQPAPTESNSTTAAEPDRFGWTESAPSASSPPQTAEASPFAIPAPPMGSGEPLQEADQHESLAEETLVLFPDPAPQPSSQETSTDDPESSPPEIAWSLPDSTTEGEPGRLSRPVAAAPSSWSTSSDAPPREFEFPAAQEMRAPNPFRSDHSPSVSGGLSATPAAVRAERELVVSRNDTFWSLARDLYGSGLYFSALARYNSDRVSDPSKLPVGTALRVPPPEVLEAQFPELFAKVVTSGSSITPVGGETAGTDPPGFFVDAHSRPMYRVGREDTLSDIARRHLGRASRWREIYDLNRNRLTEPQTLRIGMILQLPADASQVMLAPDSRRSR